MGDRKPSKALQDLETNLRNAGVKTNRADDIMLRHAFVKLLPERIQQGLIYKDTEDLDEMASFADRMMDAKWNLHSSIDTVSTKMNTPVINTTSNSDIISEINAIKTMIQNQNKKLESPDHINNPNFCYYHNRYGERARKCEPPCQWPVKHNNLNSNRLQ